VEKLLREKKELQDNDRLLVLNVWSKEEPLLREKNYTFIKFAKLYLSKKFTSPDSITRARRKAQEINPELRGESYYKRQNNQKNVIEKLRLF